jgi:proline iminopeptidase
MTKADLKPLGFAGADGVTLSAFGIGGGHRATLLCLPGGPGFSVSSLKPGMLALAKTFDLVLLDPRGHGDSDKPKDGNYSMAAYARDTLAVARALKESAPASALLGILGHSFGGCVAMEALSIEPELFDFSVLVASPFDASWRGGIAEVLEQLGIAESTQAEGKRFIAAPTDESCKDLMVNYAPLYFPELGQEEARKIMRQWSFTVAPYLVGNAAILPELNLAAKALRIEVPSLVVAGKRDAVIPSAHMARLGALIPRATYREIEGAGHFPFQTQENAFFSAVNDWWRSESKGVQK